MNSVRDSAPIPLPIVEAAITWHVRHSSGLMCEAEQADLTHWLAEHPDHARAWQRLQRMSEHLHTGVPQLTPTIVNSILKRLPDLKRRKALRLLSLSLVSGGSLYLGRNPLRDAAFPADYRTATGERREVRLADGTLLQLNTDSAVDIRFDSASRRILLRRGDIHITTGRDPSGRPFQVEARDGTLIPMGTRFTVSQLSEGTLLGVNEGAVDVLRNGTRDALRVESGQQLAFGGTTSPLQQPLDESLQAWTVGMISAENRRLDDLLAELARHRRGHLGCTPQAGELRITGTWPLLGDNPSEAVLASLERHLPIRTQRLTRYWIKVETR